MAGVRPASTSLRPASTEFGSESAKLGPTSPNCGIRSDLGRPGELRPRLARIQPDWTEIGKVWVYLCVLSRARPLHSATQPSQATLQLSLCILVVGPSPRPLGILLSLLLLGVLWGGQRKNNMAINSQKRELSLLPDADIQRLTLLTASGAISGSIYGSGSDSDENQCSFLSVERRSARVWGSELQMGPKTATEVVVKRRPSILSS